MSEIQYGCCPTWRSNCTRREAEHKGFTLLQDKVTAEEIAQVVSRWTGIPVSKMLEGEREKLLQMEAQLHARVVGQDEAIKVVSDSVRRSRGGLSDPTGRPVRSCSWARRASARPSCARLCRIPVRFLRCNGADRHERVHERHSVARLIGAPPGYVGYEEGGYLTEAVRRRPYSLILLDESRRRTRTSSISCCRC